MDNLARILLDRVSDPLLVVDQERRPLLINRAFSSFLGIKSIEEGALESALSSAWPSLRDLELRAGDAVTHVKRKKGDSIRVKIFVERLDTGRWLVRLLSDNEMKKSLIDFHAERLQTLGMLAGGVAHDFNNILAGILGHTTYLCTILPPKGPHSESLVAVEEGARKASLIVQQILSFSRLDSAEKIRKCDLGPLITRTCALLRGAIPPDYDLKVEIPESPISIMGIESKLAQVIVNLVVNARDALAPGGTIKVRLSGALNAAQDNIALLEVQDNGHGMPKDVLERAFEPYYTTKREKGTGLGLSTVHAIVELLGGTIDVVSTVGVGTSFSLSFPLLSAEAAQLLPGRADDPRPMQSSKGERILIVDDEYPVRNVLSLSLEHLGYDVAIAASGDEALQIVRDAETPFDLVILDMLMPNLSGEEVYFKLREFDPGINVLIISGYASEESVQNILDNGGLDFIQKPFTIGELSQKVRVCLDMRGQP